MKRTRRRIKRKRKRKRKRIVGIQVGLHASATVGGKVHESMGEVRDQDARDDDGCGELAFFELEFKIGPLPPFLPLP